MDLIDTLMVMRTLPSHSEMLRAVEMSDASFDGLFVTAVRTTGIFCRPSCSARKPRPENIEFFASPREALAAGYRPCKRCHPMSVNEPTPAWVQELLRLAEETTQRRLRDADLRDRDIDPIRARRHFKQHYGMTWQAYHRAVRLGAAFAHLRRGGDQMTAGLAHGWESSSAFADAFKRLFSATPGRSRWKDRLVVAWVETPIGPFIAGATDRGLCLFEFADRRSIEAQIKGLCARFEVHAAPGTSPVIESLKQQVTRYFAGSLTSFSVPLSLRGTPFQERVWRELLAIPFGETRSYDCIARAIGQPKARRAVGRANGQNRIALLIPCHRVIGADGRLCGYGGGVWRKQYLLDQERAVSLRGRNQVVQPGRSEPCSFSESLPARNGKAKSAIAGRFARVS